MIEEEGFEELRQYLGIKDDSKDGDVSKLTSLCDHLASLFVTYSLYVPEIENRWDENLSQHWQKRIWEKVFSNLSYNKCPYKILNQKARILENSPRLFFFNISYMPRPYFELLEYISSKIKMEFFLVSPCAYFWTDVQNDFEKALFLRKVQKLSVAKKQVNELESYLHETNPLLANLGRLGRQWMRFIEEKEVGVSENYIIPIDAKELAPYQDRIDESKTAFSQKPFTLLKGVQTDILLMRSKEKELQIDEHLSIQIHQASTYQREVEVLYQNLLKLFGDDNTLKPSDVVVYVANIENYIPYIENIFSREQSKIEALIHNYPFAIKNKVLKAVLSLLELDSSRWGQKKLLELFYHPAFMNRFNLTPEILQKWQSWIDEIGPCWGYDKDEQLSFLEMQYGQKANGDESITPSWEEFIDTVIKYLCEHHENAQLLPNLESIDFSSSDHLNLFIEVLMSLKKDFRLLRYKKKPFSDWASTLEDLINSYFRFDVEDQSDAQKILGHIKLFQSYHSKSDDNLFEFETFYYYLKKELLDFQSKTSNLQLESVSFYSLFNSTPIPSKITYVVGLNDMVFPRISNENPLSLMSKFTQKDFCPAIVDYDRYLFLEILLSAKDMLFLSYLGYCVETFKEVEPSILIVELLSYLDQFFVIGSQKPSEKILYKHPHLGFNAKYFAHKNYLSQNYLLAQSYYEKSKKNYDMRLDLFSNQGGISSSIDYKNEISIQDLCMLIKDPIGFGMKKRHKIFLEPLEINHENQHFILPPLQKGILKKEMFKKHFLSNEDELPKGIFKKLAQETLTEDRQAMEGFLKEHSLSSDEFFDVEFRKDVKEPLFYDGRLWVVPSLKLPLNPYLTIELTGKLETVSRNGLLSTSVLSIESMIAELPKYLIYLCLNQIFEMGVEPKWLFAKSKSIKTLEVDDPLHLLKKYLQFYFLCSSQSVPLLPAWIPYFITSNPKVISDRICKDISSPHFYNKYAKAALSKVQIPDTMIEIWQLLAQDLFQESYEILKNESV